MSGIEYMKEWIGLQEVRDKTKLVNIFKQYSKNGDILVNPSTTPWCACIMNAAERAAGNPGTGRQNARSFSLYGNKVASIEKAQEGDLLVFKRGSNAWMGHICYFVNYNKKTGLVTVLGGNQNDMICYSHYPIDRLIAIRRYV